MKLGIFDSGLGGLVIAKSIRSCMPDIDLIYFGDTLHIPYGNKSSDAIYEYSKRSIDFLFEQGCALIIVACNTVSANALRRLQQEYLPNSIYRGRRILGVVVPTLECAIERGYKNLALIATNYTVQSNIFEHELQKLNSEIKITQKNTPLLVPLIENDGEQWIMPVLQHYLGPILQESPEVLILGCTHYPFLKRHIQNIVGEPVDILSQDEIIPEKLCDYLQRHPEISKNITRNTNTKFLASDITQSYIAVANKIYNEKITVEHVKFCMQKNKYEREVNA